MLVKVKLEGWAVGSADIVPKANVHAGNVVIRESVRFQLFWLHMDVSKVALGALLVTMVYAPLSRSVENANAFVPLVKPAGTREVVVLIEPVTHERELTPKMKDGAEANP
jgi:hypothetical protein